MHPPLAFLRKGGLSSRGVAFMTVLAVLQSTLPPTNTVPRGSRYGFDGFGGFGGCGGFGRDGSPLFRDPDFIATRSEKLFCHLVLDLLDISFYLEMRHNKCD